MGHVTTLKLQETEHEDCHVWFGPVKDTRLPQVKSELGSSKECGVGIGQQLTRLPLMKFSINAFMCCLAHKGA